MGGLPEDLAFELVEPIRDLFKDEVRRLGTTLGLPFEMLYVIHSQVQVWACVFWVK